MILSMTAQAAQSGTGNPVPPLTPSPIYGQGGRTGMEKQVDHMRLARLLLMIVDGDAQAALAHIKDGRIDLARLFAASVVKNVQKIQDDLSKVAGE